MLVVTLSVIYVSRPLTPAPIVRRVEAPRSPADMRRALASLDAEAQASMAVVERLVAAEERRGAARRARVPDPLIFVRREQDRAAHLLVLEADRLAKQLNERERAAAEYRRIVSLFPDTHGAAMARERLAEMGGSSDRRNKAAPHVIVVPGTTKELS